MPNRTNPELAMRVWLRLIRLEARMQAAVGDRLRMTGVSIPQCDVLTTLSEQKGVNQQELAKRLYVTKGNISGLLDRLEAAGFVERRSLASDRRQYSIHLTDAGRTMAEKAIAGPAQVAGLDPRTARGERNSTRWRRSLSGCATSCASRRRRWRPRLREGNERGSPRETNRSPFTPPKAPGPRNGSQEADRVSVDAPDWHRAPWSVGRRRTPNERGDAVSSPLRQSAATVPAPRAKRPA